MTAAPTAAQPAPEAAKKPRHLLAVPLFRNLWIGATISLLGDQFYLVALPWLVLQLTGSGLVLGVGIVNVQFTTWIQMRVERAILGRVMSVLMFSAVGLIPVSYAISGFVAQWNLPALFVAAGVLLCATSFISLGGKAARKLD